MQGCNPKDMLITVAEEGIPRTDWAVVLRALLRKMSHSVPCLHRPSRRLPHLIGIVPGKRRTVGRPKVIAVIDTSGSMNNHKVLSLIREEIKSLSSAADIWVVECDTKIHREYRYNGKLEHVRGGGGTSFVEPLSSQFLAQHRASLVLYFTDGRGNAPMQNPRIPVLWCLIGQKTRKPADYGKVLRIASPLEKEVF